MLLQNSILEKQLRIVSSTFLNAYTNKKNLINFRCNVCGDTDINKHKKSAYLVLRYNSKYGYDTWQFYCHRGSCGSSMLAEVWLKKYFPANYRNYQKDLLSYNIVDTNKELEKIEEDNKLKLQEELEKNKIEELEDVKYFIPILNDHKLCSIAQKYCKTRLIDYDIWSKWYVSIDKKYKNRMIIPFYNQLNEVYYWQGRALYNYMIPKYLNRVDNRNEALYNYHHINKNNPVILLEGIIDSLFVDNSIAVLGTNITEECSEKLKPLNKYYLFDNDEPGYKKSYEYLLKGNKVFLWKLFLKDNKVFEKIKDINDLIIYNQDLRKKLNFDYLNKYFTNNIFDKIYLI